MRVALLANFDKEISQNSTGGSEMFTYLLASHLAINPHIEKIHVFGIGSNHFNNPKIVFHQVYSHEPKDFIHKNQPLTKELEKRPDTYSKVESTLAMKLIYMLVKIQNDVDIVHNNSTSVIINSSLKLFQKPFVTTLHTNASSPSIIIPYVLKTLDVSNQFFVAIANHQTNFIKTNKIPLSVSKTIYNGIDTKAYTFAQKNTESGGLWIGRISAKHNKGAKEAIIASQQSGNPLKLYATVDDENYFQTRIQSLLEVPLIRYSQYNLTPQTKQLEYQKAKYFLYPIMWEEPFGLIFLESMASGTPVIAFARGAVPEIIQDGITGFIVNPSSTDVRGDWIVKKTGIDGIVEAINRINSLPLNTYLEMRRQSRDRVEKKFTVDRMTTEYINLYAKILSQKIHTEQ